MDDQIHDPELEAEFADIIGPNWTPEELIAAMDVAYGMWN